MTKIFSKYLKYPLIVLFVFINQFVYSQTYNLTVKITNFEKIHGNIEVSVYNNQKDFPKELKEYKTSSTKVNEKTEIVTFSNLPKGEYAIAIFHDENSDGECNRTILGIPKEGYGFSNNIKPKISAPSFNECKFMLNDNKTITIKLIL